MRSLHPPRGITAVLARMKEAERVAGGIPKTRLAPEPRLVGRRTIEPDALVRKALDVAIQVVALQVDHRSRPRRELGDALDRKGALAVRARKTNVARQSVDDQVEPQFPIEVRSGGDIPSR